MLIKLLAASALLALVACGASTGWDRELGSEVDKGDFGNATMNNTLIQTGELQLHRGAGRALRGRSADTINFAFNSAAARSPRPWRSCTQQADWIRQFPEVRFRVYGHTDLVGSAGYNQRSACAAPRRRWPSSSRRASAARGSRRWSRYGKTRPLIADATSPKCATAGR